MPNQSSTNGYAKDSFSGFEYPDSNYIYCPNQLFDLALPLLTLHQWRLLCYLFYRTLSTVDRDGNPVRQDISLSRTEMQKEARINRQTITPTLQRLVDIGLISRTKQAIPNSYNGKGTAAQYRLNWAKPEEPYTTNINYFAGFFTGNGHRTPIPKAFFTQMVPYENHAVNKIVGTVLRHTIGFQSQFGGRVEDAPMAFGFIKQYANIKSDSTVNDAIKACVEKKYIECVERGKFAFDPKRRKTARYRICWLKGTKSVAEEGGEIRSRNRQKSAVAQGDDSRSNKTSSTRKKQQTGADNNKSLKLLLDQGFSKPAALQIVQQAGEGVVEKQVAWKKHRNPTKNELGFLRKAILENWEIPEALARKQKQEAHWKEQKKVLAVDELKSSITQRNRKQRKRKQLNIWNSLDASQRERIKQQAIAQEASQSMKSILAKKCVVKDSPPFQFLEQLSESSSAQKKSPQKKHLLGDPEDVLAGGHLSGHVAGQWNES